MPIMHYACILGMVEISIGLINNFMGEQWNLFKLMKPQWISKQIYFSKMYAFSVITLENVFFLTWNKYTVWLLD